MNSYAVHIVKRVSLLGWLIMLDVIWFEVPFVILSPFPHAQQGTLVWSLPFQPDERSCPLKFRFNKDNIRTSVSSAHMSSHKSQHFYGWRGSTFTVSALHVKHHFSTFPLVFKAALCIYRAKENDWLIMIAFYFKWDHWVSNKAASSLWASDSLPFLSSVLTSNGRLCAVLCAPFQHWGGTLIWRMKNSREVRPVRLLLIKILSPNEQTGNHMD